MVLSGARQSPPRQAQLSWWDRAPEEKVGSYWIKTDLPAERANALARHLNLMYEEYSRRLASLPIRAQEKLNVLIFANAQDYLLTLRARFGVNAAGTGGIFFVSSAGSALAFWTGDLPTRRVEHVVQHEGFHQFAYSRFGTDLPIWVNEGLAEFFGEGVMVGEKLIIGQSTPRVIDTVKNAIELNEHIPFRRMLMLTPAQWSAHVQAGDANLQYHQAWSMVHFLVYGDAGKYQGALELYLKHLNNGLPSEEAFARAFGPDTQAFENRWKQYALDAQPSAFVTALERIEFLAEGLLELSRQKVHPETMDELKQKLREIRFKHIVKTHGTAVTLDAKDDALFTIPADDLNAEGEQPVFVLAKPDLRRLLLRERKLEEENPTPMIVSTEKMRPRGVTLRWIRNAADNTFSYEIVVR